MYIVAKPINEHYVAQSYLRAFTYDGEHLFFFDKKTQDVKPANVRNMASERGFYDFTKEMQTTFEAAVANGEWAHMDPKLLEYAMNPRLVDDELTQREAILHVVFERFLNDAKNQRFIGYEQRLLMSYYMALQYLRTREMRLSLVELVEKGTTAMIEAKLGVSLEEHNLRLKYNEDYAPLLQAEAIFSTALMDRLVEAMMSHVWLVGHNRTNQPFYTSDHPVIRIPHEGSAGFASKGVEVALPLDPQHVLMLYERQAFQHLAPGDGTYVYVDEQGVHKYNYGQMASSYRRLYCGEDKFDFARMICREEPGLCDPDRSRFTVVKAQPVQTDRQHTQKKPAPRPKGQALTRRARKALERYARTRTGD